MDKITMEDSIYIQKFKQKLNEKKNNKEDVQQDQEIEGQQIDFKKYFEKDG